MKRFLILTAIGTALSMAISACAKSESALPSDTTLTSMEKDGVLFMREEEKLAFDMYNHLYAKWGIMPFQQIRFSEQMHMDAVKTILDRYGLPDPAAGQPAGAFANDRLQQLYAQLLAKGDSSVIQALTVGAIIEEVDILDLKSWLSSTTHPDIRLVYENLMRGSRNHLRAFVNYLSMQGITYAPQYLDPKEYEAIIHSPMESGGMRGMRRGG